MQKQRVSRNEMQTNGVPTIRRKSYYSLNHNQTRNQKYYTTKNMALKSSATGKQQSTIKTTTKQPVRNTNKALIAGLPIGAFYLASSVILTLFLIISLTITQTNSNPLNNHLLQQVTKPFLVIKRDRKHSISENNSPADNMKISSSANPSSSSSASSSSTRNNQQKRPMLGKLPMHLATPLKMFKPTINPSNGSSQNYPETLNHLESAPDHLASSNNRFGTLSTSGNDLNNNSPNLPAHDINNNTIQTSPVDNYGNRNVNSVNGTIDLSLYANSDVDRLYGDALLVYVKNFNDTLPARKETITLNGTLVPAYRSTSRVSRVPKWQP